MKKVTLFIIFLMCSIIGMAQQNPKGAKEQYELGLKYLNEQNNKDRAIFWLEKSANQGYAEAQFYLSMLLDPGPFAFGDEAEENKKAALSWMEKAAEQNFPLALYGMAQNYQFGMGVKEDAKKAAEYYTRYVETGAPEAQFEVGKMYIKGSVFEKNGQKGMDLIMKAAKQDYKPAWLFLANVCEKKGMRNEAKQSYEKCLNSNDPKIVEEAKKGIERLK